MNFKYKIGVSIATAAFLGSILAPAAFAADNTCTISGNGAHSTNNCRIKIETSKKIVQVNKAFVKNVVITTASTGGNKANDNTGGDVSITAGDATVTVTITNTVNSNTLTP